MQLEELQMELAAGLAEKSELERLEKKLAALEEVQRRLDEQRVANQLKRDSSTAEPDNNS